MRQFSLTIVSYVGLGVVFNASKYCWFLMCVGLSNASMSQKRDCDVELNTRREGKKLGFRWIKINLSLGTQDLSLILNINMQEIQFVKQINMLQQKGFNSNHHNVPYSLG